MADSLLSGLTEVTSLADDDLLYVSTATNQDAKVKAKNLPASLTHVVCPAVNYNTAGLTAGVSIYVPTIGERLFDAWPEIPTAFNGTTPHGDIALNAGFVAGGGLGLYGQVNFPILLAEEDVTGTSPAAYLAPLAGMLAPQDPTVTTISASTAGASSWWRPPTFISTAPLLFVVSQDGKQGGAAVGGSAGQVIWHLLILPA